MHDKLIVKLPCYQIKIDNKQFKSSRVVSTSFDFSITQILIDLLIKYQLSKLLKNIMLSKKALKFDFAIKLKRSRALL
ncbi:hypothetical protein AOR13_3491 [Alteromonas stellipolaris LMG 21856]|jgi:hypothetical protein|nr:hypothetical protein AOR13_3484 [Alteromonas stellipolaris LMG 21856]ALM92485.1 hypothetical protein AOR13_3491 [Alteromonas stellipolaris LMG 21856]